MTDMANFWRDSVPFSYELLDAKQQKTKHKHSGYTSTDLNHSHQISYFGYFKYSDVRVIIWFRVGPSDCNTTKNHITTESYIYISFLGMNILELGFQTNQVW